MNRPQFVFRPNLRDPSQRRAWQLLQDQPAGERSAYLAACILKASDQAAAQEGLRTMLREELGKIYLLQFHFKSCMLKLMKDSGWKGRRL